jgi:uncharacterized protein (DUF305 family)
MRRIPALVALAVAAALTLVACGGSNTTSGGSADATSTPSAGSVAADFNDADVTFAQTMIPHHEQAVQMAEMAQTHAASAEVKRLAAEIEAAQGPEIDTMRGWLEAWAQPQPSTMGGGDHGMSDMDVDDMPGMMSDDDLSELGDAQGDAWDRMFLTMMIAHHEGAIQMARTEQADGRNLDAIALATQIEADQKAEIATMRDMLRS